MIARGAFNNAVWMDGPRQWKSAKLIWLSLHYSIRLEKDDKTVAFLCGSPALTRPRQ